MGKLLTVAEVATRTGVPEGTWRYWRSIGEGLAFVRLGKRLRISEDVLDAWLTEQMEGMPTGK